MKYLKSYKIFESLNESEYREIIADLEDMSFDVQDLDVKVNIWSEKLEKRVVSTTAIPKSYYNAIQINIKELWHASWGLKSSAIEEVKYFINRAISFMPGWKVKMFGSKDFKVSNFQPDELEKHDFYEIFIRFYKPENTYHIVRYLPNQYWSIQEADIKSLEKAEERLITINREIKKSNYIGVARDVLYSDKRLRIITDLEYWKALGNAKYFS
jgi:hypothetical protein